MHSFRPIVKSSIKCLTHWVIASREYKKIHKENRNKRTEKIFANFTTGTAVLSFALYEAISTC